MQVLHKYKFGKEEKLKSRKVIQLLFASGNKLNQFPFRCLWLRVPADEGVRLAVSVSSRNFKKAVHRNRIKRLMREAYRQHKSILFERKDPRGIAFVIIYTGTEMPVFSQVEKAVKTLLEKISGFINEPH